METIDDKETTTTSLTSLDDFIVNFEQIPHIALVFPIFTLNK